MKIKSLLLGSAAAMIAVSGAQAADAIIVEPEPMEYVKVCDMYGAGFFYIPGTETCMNINGYVRSTYSHTEIEGKARDAAGAPVAFVRNSAGALVTSFEENTSSWTVRGRLNFDVRNETEYGTLRSELRIQGGDATAAGDPNVAIDRALIHLAGFRLGYSDTYWTTNHGYGAGSPAINDGFYNYDQAIFFDYTATLMDGVSVTVGVQDSNGTVAGAASPDFYAGLNATFGGLTVAATVLRDSDTLETNAARTAFVNTDDSWAWKVSAIAALGDSGWTVGGWYMSSDNPHNQYVSGNAGFWGNRASHGGLPLVAGTADRAPTDNQWGVQVNGAVSSNLSVYGLYSEADGKASTNKELLAGFVSADVHTTHYAIGAVWAPVSGLTVQFEYSATDSEWKNGAGAAVDKYNLESDGYHVRVTRSF